MIGLGWNELYLPAVEGRVVLKRNRNGIPTIRAENFTDLYFGLGWIQAHDRMLSMEINRLIGRGQAAECLDSSLLNLDLVMRRFNLYRDAEMEVSKLDRESKKLVDAFCSGVNRRINERKLPFEFKLIGHHPEYWTSADSIMISKLIGIIDLTETQAWMEKFIIQMLRQGYSPAMIRELFPYLKDEPDEEYLDIIRRLHLSEPMVPETVKWAELPRLQCSNNWAVSGTKSASGKPIFCSDPHLDISRLPAIWQEVIMQSGDYYIVGATIPGIPGFPIGRTRDLAWAPTYGNMDVLDYYIEDVRGKMYRRGEQWVPFDLRKEDIKIRGKEPITVNYYENLHGVLEKEPDLDGYYLCLAWSSGRNCGAETLNSMPRILTAKTAEEALKYFACLDFAAFNWTVADSEGNIGYQMSGRNPVRREGCSGLIPLPGWDESYDWNGYYDRNTNPSILNPDEHFIVTANQNLNHLGQKDVINLEMAPYRARRISEQLASTDEHDFESMKRLQYDTYSKQAEDFMAVIKPFLPDSENGRLLAEWDCRYSADSKAPVIFENIYTELMRLVFGDLNFGRSVHDYLVHETVLMHDYYYNFDRVLLSENSVWFDGRKREEIFAEAVNKGLALAVEPYGDNRKVMLRHIMLGGRFPRWFGFDYGPLTLIGGRATVSISQIFKTVGRESTFAPAYRFVTDFAREGAYTVLAGGPSDRRFSAWYTSGIKDWISGNYQLVEPLKQE